MIVMVKLMKDVQGNDSDSDFISYG